MRMLEQVLGGRMFFWTKPAQIREVEFRLRTVELNIKKLDSSQLVACSFAQIVTQKVN